MEQNFLNSFSPTVSSHMLSCLFRLPHRTCINLLFWMRTTLKSFKTHHFQIEEYIWQRRWITWYIIHHQKIFSITPIELFPSPIPLLIVPIARENVVPNKRDKRINNKSAYLLSPYVQRVVDVTKIISPGQRNVVDWVLSLQGHPLYFYFLQFTVFDCLFFELNNIHQYYI